MGFPQGVEDFWKTPAGSPLLLEVLKTPPFPESCLTADCKTSRSGHIDVAQVLTTAKAMTRHTWLGGYCSDAHSPGDDEDALLAVQPALLSVCCSECSHHMRRSLQAVCLFCHWHCMAWHVQAPALAQVWPSVSLSSRLPHYSAGPGQPPAPGVVNRRSVSTHHVIKGP